MTEIGAESIKEEKAKDKARREAARKGTCTTRRRMAERFAGSGTLNTRDAASIVAEFINARFAWAAIPCMPVPMERRILRRTPQETERKSDQQKSRLLPHSRPQA